MGRPNGLFIDTPPGMPYSGSTTVKPPATQAHAAMESTHGTQMTYFTRLSHAGRDGLPTAVAASSCSPPAAHSHPHHARRSTMAVRNCRPNTSMLAATTPESAPSMMSTGEK